MANPAGESESAAVRLDFDRTVFERKRQETCALTAEKLRLAGLTMANLQHPQRIISLSRV